MFSRETVEEAIIRLYKSGYKRRRIRDLLKVGPERISKTLNYYLLNNEIPSASSIGRPKKSTMFILNQICDMTVQNRIISCEKISQNLSDIYHIEISPTTVYRLRKSLQFNYKPPKIKQFLTQNQIEYRKLFARSILSNQINTNLFIFSDESRFCFTNDGGWKWYRKDEINDDVFCKKAKFSEGIMVFGAIGYKFKSKLVICENNINDVEYRKIIEESNLVEDLDNKYEPGNYFFMQDGAPAHKSFLSSLYLKKRLTFLKSWPANSPDLNPIEHLWGAIKRILKTIKINSKEELIQKVTEIWESFPQESIDSLVLSFPTRLKWVISENGGSISNILRSSIHKDVQINIDQDEKNLLSNDRIFEYYDPNIDDNPIEFKSKRPFSIEEDILILQKFSEIGSHWKIIAQYFTDRTPTSLRTRYYKIRGRTKLTLPKLQ